MSIESCTPPQGASPYHIVRGDFLRICGDFTCGNALRVFEVLTNMRINNLRNTYSIPAGVLPHEDDLWLETPVRTLEALSLKTRSKSSYARTLGEDHPRTLLQLGFLRRRFVARPGTGALQTPMTPLQHDEAGPFILVMNIGGEYVGSDGESYHALEQGWTRISPQYVYCIEAVNAALAERAGREAPVPAPRWQPIREENMQARKNHGRGQEMTNSTSPATVNEITHPIRGGIVPFGNQHITTLTYSLEERDEA